jgi:hypothetical protein
LKEKGYQPEFGNGRATSKASDDRLKHENGFEISPATTKQPRPDAVDVEKKPKETRRAKHPMRPEYKKVQYQRKFLVGIALIILISSLITSYLNYLSLSDPGKSTQEQAYDLMKDVQDFDVLNLEYDDGSYTWEVNKYLGMSSEDLTEKFPTDFKYLIEVFDLSSYPLKYNRTLENGLAWNSLNKLSDTAKELDEFGYKFKISAFVNIYVSSEEIHLARIDVTVWK